ncbi:hypothetical protein SCP_1601000 [Sparassis crispa]|uniref:F-box domain-containing protein n=1 Tax=Sparassis crispa TaxID=139825 RepID=A0A401H4T3_9APHY|nr:hypothetical protein SCP_1601000 [Sparassis crispa]GBE89438.1 hypothetical protein SCP_1601000 [Sparassis crispa]
MQSGKLPLELCEDIIGRVPDDRKTLAACGLTCRQWLPIIRPRLFRSANISRKEDCIRLEKALNAPKGSVLGIGPYIEELIIQSRGGPFPPTWLDRWLPRLLPKLDRVRHLTLNKLDWHRGGLREATRNCILTFSRIVDTLVLDDIMLFDEPLGLWKLLSAYPKLSSLWIGNITETTSMLPPVPALEASDGVIQIQNFVLKRVVAYECPSIHFLLQPPFQLRLSVLSWGEVTVGTNASHLGAFLIEAGRSLQHLDFTLKRLFDPSEYFSLASNMELISLRITNKLPMSQFTCVPTLISEIASPNFRQLDFEFEDPFDLGRYFEMDWEEIDEALSSLGHRLPFLVISFSYWPWKRTHAIIGWLQKMLNFLLAQLPRLAACGTTLRVLCCCDSCGRNSGLFVSNSI